MTREDIQVFTSALYSVSLDLTSSRYLSTSFASASESVSCSESQSSSISSDARTIQDDVGLAKTWIRQNMLRYLQCTSSTCGSTPGNVSWCRYESLARYRSGPGLGVLIEWYVSSKSVLFSDNACIHISMMNLAVTIVHVVRIHLLIDSDLRLLIIHNVSVFLTYSDQIIPHR
jgi:hypothetical protein